MPEFYIIFARNIVFVNFEGSIALPAPVYYTYGKTDKTEKALVGQRRLPATGHVTSSST